MARDGAAQPPRRIGMLRGEARAAADAGERMRQVAQRNRVGRDRAAVGASRPWSRGRSRWWPAAPRSRPASPDDRRRCSRGRSRAGPGRRPGGRRGRGSRRACPSSCCAARSARCPAAAIWRWIGSRYGQCAPHSSAPRSSPARASIRATTAVCSGSPLCEAQAIASSSSTRPSWSAAPLATSGRACSTFTAERGKIGRSMSPSDATRAAVGIDHGDGAAMRRFAGAAAHRLDQDGIHAAIVVARRPATRRRQRPRRRAEPRRMGGHQRGGPPGTLRLVVEESPEREVGPRRHERSAAAAAAFTWRRPQSGEREDATASEAAPPVP